MSGGHFSSQGWADADDRRIARERKAYEEKKATNTAIALIAFMERKGFVLMDEKQLSEQEVNKLVQEFVTEYAK